MFSVFSEPFSRPAAPMIAALLLGVLIGMMVGLVGGGGAVLAVPVLVYVVGLDVHEATTVSLAVVAAAAATGAIGQLRRGTVCWASAGWFGAAAIVGGAVGTALNALVGGAGLMYLFGGVMLLAARATWQRAAAPSASDAACPRARARILMPVGFAVGTLTGLIGVGGGFVVVPALAIGLSFGMRQAMGTSMVIVAIVSLSGLFSHLAAGNPFDAEVAFLMGAATVVGATLGARLAPRVSVPTLGRGFAVLLAVMSAGVIAATAAGIGV